MLKIQAEKIPQPAYWRKSSLGDDYDAETSGDLCIHDLIAMDKANWLKAWGRVKKRFSVIELPSLWEEGGVTDESFAAALLWPDTDLRKATVLAKNNSLGELESYLYFAQTWEEFAAGAVAIAHYESLRSYSGQALQSIQILERDNVG